MALLGKFRPMHLLVLFLLLAAVFVIASGNSKVSNWIPGADRQVINCNVAVKNLLLQSPKIESFNCQRENACFLTFAPSFQLFVPSDKVYLQLTTSLGESSGIKQFSVTEQLITGTSKTVEVGVCTSAVSGSIKLYDNKNEITDQKQWSVN